MTIDARGTQDAVAADVWNVVLTRLNPAAQTRALSKPPREPIACADC